MTVRRVGQAVVAVLVVAIGLLGWRVFGPDNAPAGTAELTVDGIAKITNQDGITEVIDDTRVSFGDEVEITEGTATLVLDDREYGLRAGVAERSNTVVTVGETPRLERGDLLVETETSATVVAGDSTVTVERGASQVVLADVVTVRVYTGRASAVTADRSGAAVALRSFSYVPGERLTVDGAPLQYVGQDPDDRRFLGEAIAFGDRLERKVVGFVANLPRGTEVDARFLERTLPGLADDEDFRATFVDPSRADDELLIGASIASLGRQGSLPERWDEVFAFRDAGAHWGLVALDQGVSEAPALEVIDIAISREELAFTTPPTTAPPVGPGPPEPPGTSVPPPTTPTTTPPTTPPPSTPPTTPPPDPGGPLDPLLDPVDDLVDDLLGGVLGQGRLVGRVLGG